MFDSPGLTLGGRSALPQDLRTIASPTFLGLTLNNVKYTWPAADGTADQRLTTNGSGVLSWATAGGAALSGITAATAANTIANGDNAQVWQWALTTAGKFAFRFSESAASTAIGTAVLVHIDTLAASTIHPLMVKSRGTEVFRVVGNDNNPQIQALDGTSNNPSYSFLSAGNSGLNIVGTEPRMMSNGSNSAFFASTGLQSPAGSAGSPGMTDFTSKNSGLFFGSSILGIAVGAIENSRFIANAFQASQAGANTTAYAINSRKARGTVASPTVITTGDDLLTISGFGYVGATNTYVEAANILFDSTGTIADTATGVGGIISLQTRAVGGALTEAFNVRGGATPQILTADGSASSPILSFASATNTGLYMSAGRPSYTVLGNAVMVLDSVQLRIRQGSAGTPSLTDFTLINSGLFFFDTGIGMSVNLIENSRFITAGFQSSIGSADAVSYAINSRKARGTVASPTVITTGDNLLTISGYGYVGATNTYVEATQILHDSIGTISDSSTGIGGFIAFLTRNVGASLTEQFRINEDGGMRLPAIAAASATEGNLWNDSTRKAITGFIDGINTKFSGSVYVATASATVSNTTTETTIVSTGIGTQTLPVNFLTAGKTIRVTASGVYGTDAVSAATLTLRIKLGSTVILTTGANIPNGSLTNRGWSISSLITCRTTGATGTVFGQGRCNLSTDATTAQTVDMENTATQTVDTTATQVVDVTAQWGVGVAAADTITGTNILIEVLD